jgi:hypothetical protein
MIDLSRRLIWPVFWLALVASCRPAAKPPADLGPALPVDRIAIVGASVSAGFGGTPFGDAFEHAAKHSKVASWANVMMFRDPVGDTHAQLAKAIDFHATTVIAIDLLFWHVYNVHSLDAAFAELDTLHATGAWIVLGDVPRITTASELLLPKSAIPSQAEIDAANQQIAAWAKRDRVLVVPLAAWTEPLRSGSEIEIAPGEKVPAASLMALDGLHANPLGTWYLLDRLDHFLETKLPGTPKDALVFARPSSI